MVCAWKHRPFGRLQRHNLSHGNRWGGLLFVGSSHKTWANGLCFHLAKWNNIFTNKGDYPSYSLSFEVLGGVFGRYNLTVKVFSIISDEVRVHGSGGRVTYRIFPNMVQTSERLESHHVWLLYIVPTSWNNFPWKDFNDSLKPSCHGKGMRSTLQCLFGSHKPTTVSGFPPETVLQPRTGLRYTHRSVQG